KSDNELGLDAFREIGPGGHFLGCAHTQTNFETAFHRFDLHDSNSVEQWEADGSKDMAVRANERWKETLAAYQAPALDPGVSEAITAFVDQRKASMPDQNY
ncbi:MAG: trimethylamine methyltransferase family protein, partial [Pseudomonadota bacterium]